MFKLYNGDCLEVLRKCPDNYIDAIVTDPPYGLSFMGKKWDYDVPSVEIWKECLRVLKPGGHLLAFGGTRTYHRLVVAIEDAGFEIRDQIQWIYGQGFPKSQDISKAIDKAAGAEATTDYIPQESNKVFNHGKGKAAGVDRTPGAKLSGPAVTTDAQKWSGWGTALKPANEPVCLARKPLSESTIAKNVLKWGTGGLNIDGTRIGIAEGDTTGSAKSAGSGSGKVAPNTPFVGGITSPPHELGRFPSNVILDEAAAQVLDGQVASEVSRFFYVAKASTSDRNSGCKDLITWERLDQNQVDQTVAASQLLKATLDGMTPKLSDTEWNTLWSGKLQTDQSQKVLTSTTKTETSSITTLATLNALANLTTSENIQAAIRTIETSGLSLVENVGRISQLKVSTTSERMESLLGAVLAVLQTLLPIREQGKKGNVHSTVKPIKLMEYLCKLVTPPGGVVLDPFMGSGTTGVAALRGGFQFRGIEREESYFHISQARLEKEQGGAE
jgi:DNA modification methylase